ncbi:hypothetical protein NMY22_g19020 [Coprinellus aureogranulatus]|nr:hypothetical protein NMY22_g19020 [Coprinellus aureogranulatus]
MRVVDALFHSALGFEDNLRRTNPRRPVQTRRRPKSQRIGLKSKARRPRHLPSNESIRKAIASAKPEPDEFEGIPRDRDLREHEKRAKDEKRLLDDASVSSKFAATWIIVARLPPGEKAIIFSIFTSMLDELGEFLENSGYDIVKYDGRMSPKDRDAALKSISSDDSKRIILVSLKAGGVGLNITACNHVILLDPWWNPYVEDQAIARAWRIGQAKEVHVYHIVCPHTVEDRILAVQEKKKGEVEATMHFAPTLRRFPQGFLSSGGIRKWVGHQFQGRCRLVCDSHVQASAQFPKTARYPHLAHIFGLWVHRDDRERTPNYTEAGPCPRSWSPSTPSGSDSGMSASCHIPSNPDISGIGVRFAIYLQNLLCFLPAIWAIWDGHVSDYELESAETQSTTNLVLAFAILISCIVQASTLGLTNFHAAIVLSLSWMNNTNAFIYFLLYVQHKGQGGEGHVEPRWSAWISHIKRQARAVMQLPDALGRGTPLNTPRGQREVGREGQGGAKVLFRRIALLLGSLHLTLMAALGIWLWSAPQTFGTSSDSACAIQFAQLAILGGQRVSAPWLQLAPSDGRVSQPLLLAPFKTARYL